VDGAPDYRTAALWFRKAADRGIVDSQYNLAILYVRGFGVEQDYAESYKWFALASLLGDKDAGKKSEEVATHLDPQTLATAKLAVTNWKAEPQPEDAITVPAPPGGWDAAAANPATPKARRGGPKVSAPAAEPKVN
jgi:localization factor PodJL